MCATVDYERDVVCVKMYSKGSVSNKVMYCVYRRYALAFGHTAIFFQLY